MSYLSDLKQGVPAALQVPFASHIVSLWLGIHPTEVQRLRQEYEINVVQSRPVISELHQRLGLEIAYHLLTTEKTEAELAGQLGWSVKKLYQALEGRAALELLDLVQLKQLHLDVKLS